MEIIPTILTNSQEELEEKLKRLEGKTKWVQIDVVDNRFADNRTFPLEWLNNYQEKDFFWDIHLMVKNPFAWVEKCNVVMAERVVGHIELMGDQVDFLDRVESEGMQAGLAVDLPTPLSCLSREALFRVNLVLILTVKAGFSGQKFDRRGEEKVKELAQWREELNLGFKIGVDGGIRRSMIKRLAAAGVDVFYLGKAFWEEKEGD